MSSHIGIKPHGSSVISRLRGSGRIDRRRWDEPGVTVGTHEHLPTLMVHRGVTRPAEQAPVVDGGGPAVRVVDDVMTIRPRSRRSALHAAPVPDDDRLPDSTGEEASGLRHSDGRSVGVHIDTGERGVASDEECSAFGQRAQPIQADRHRVTDGYGHHDLGLGYADGRIGGRSTHRALDQLPEGISTTSLSRPIILGTIRHRTRSGRSINRRDESFAGQDVEVECSLEPTVFALMPGHLVERGVLRRRHRVPGRCRCYRGRTSQPHQLGWTGAGNRVPDKRALHLGHRRRSDG